MMCHVSFAFQAMQDRGKKWHGLVIGMWRQSAAVVWPAGRTVHYRSCDYLILTPVARASGRASKYNA